MTEKVIQRLAALKEDSGKYVRKFVSNVLRDISKKFPDFIRKEVEAWSLDSKEIKQVYQLASKWIKDYIHCSVTCHNWNGEVEKELY